MLSNNFGTCSENGNSSKRKRRPAGTPDPDAEVVSLSPKTLLESDRYVCEICNQGFQRDQNLQMHRRRHKVPWKLQKRETPLVRKRVFVCPEPTCLHHDPYHALGDLVGIKKHFKRKHSNHKQWICDKCSKGYAVQSDYKAHLKTCGTRGHSCDCGRVFSRVESFIEHQDACSMGRLRSESHTLQTAACLSQTASGPSPSSDTNISTVAPWPIFLTNVGETKNSKPAFLELQLLTKPCVNGEDQSTQLQLSIGSSEISEVNESRFSSSEKQELSLSRVKEQLRIAMAQKAYAEDAREQAKRQIEVAEQEFANAKRIRQQAKEELENAQSLKEHAIKKINSTILQITCHSCKQKFQTARGITEESSGFICNKRNF
ncbi:Protein SHOOT GRAVITROPISM 5 [Abeliophyllum distichum]|uniref:Protein SHOOT GRAVITROPISM 5 n=1 Tax=Abeliophyllum distichum TaxID=126358 RepID=A0ABD1PDG3_9LAMI